MKNIFTIIWQTVWYNDKPISWQKLKLGGKVKRLFEIRLASELIERVIV